MAKSTPEKLAAALRANLKRRKQAKETGAKEPPSKPASKQGQTPPKTRQ
ncbi:MAG TPA: hypothetical protein VH189_14600 [Rhizomicrobium sp.]|jgi:hypothetical protein|nr:hypothetical protein [Rhizomicrobium sp.]